MFRLLIIGGAVMTVLGIVLIPLPGPGYPLLIVGVIALLLPLSSACLRGRLRVERPESQSKGAR